MRQKGRSQSVSADESAEGVKSAKGRFHDRRRANAG